MKVKDEIEELSVKLHEIYQIEAKRQGDVRHSDDYYSLSENTKEYDRVLARFIISYAKERVIEKLNIVREISTESEVIDWARNVIAELKGESR